MKNLRASFLMALLPLGALFALAPFAGCIDPVVIGGGSQCTVDSDCPAGQLCTPNGVCSGGNNQVEVCNGIDDDGDGLTDNAAMGATLCPNGGSCVMGQCQNSPPSCSPMNPCPQGQICNPNGVCSPDNNCMPQAETCDAIDNDCDGVVDNAALGATLCPNGGSCVMGQCSNLPCATDIDCPMGQACVNGVCYGACMPQAEVCNGIDDDCNGAIDESSPNAPICPMGGSCVNGQCGNCQPSAEVCDGIDNDCDNSIDEATFGAVLCPNGGSCVMGQCISGPTPCSMMNPCPQGQVCNPNGVCVPDNNCMPTPEVCDGMDNDCNGAVDDASPNTLLCAQGKFCTMGVCTIKQCQVSNDCPPNHPCVNGLCQ